MEKQEFNESKKDKLIVISQRFPFEVGEVYLKRELKTFQNFYKRVELYPIDPTGKARKIDPFVKVSDYFKSKSVHPQKKVLFKNFFLILGILWLEYRKTKEKKFFRKNLKPLLGRLVSAVEDADNFERNILKGDGEKVDLYAVWMDEGALLFSILKKKKKIADFSFRLHGYDLYDERREGNYMPFRYFCFQQVTRIFIVSKTGKKYLEEKNIFPEKLITNYSGLYDNGLNPKLEQSNTFVICSCSNVIPLKRVTLIAEALKKLSFQIKWIHIGDGTEMTVLKEVIKELPENVSVEMKGFLPNDKVIEVYQQEPIDVFVHVSETEGLPLSLVEAMSAGIPCIATNAGGTHEIVNESNGILLPVNLEIEVLSNAISKVQSDSTYWKSLKKGAREEYLSNFSADVNYPKFAKQIAGIK